MSARTDAILNERPIAARPAFAAPADVAPGAGLAPISRLETILNDATRRGASDTLMVAGAPVTIYAQGHWQSLSDEVWTDEAIRVCLETAMDASHRERLEQLRDLDFAIVVGSYRRYRVNVHYQRGSLAAAFRTIPTEIPPFEQLGLPTHILKLADLPNGLVLVTGGTGQGKSTTLAALVDHINRTRTAHIITIEDPVEFHFVHGLSIVEQREVGADSPSFASALRHVLRQRPDVILIGEIRDRETIATALTAAETGHLVLASLHTSSAAQTLARITDVFPAEQQPQVRTQLAASLRAIVCQVLLTDASQEGLVPATEILIANPAVRRALRENESHLIYGMMETGKTGGMHTLEQSLAELVRTRRVKSEEALSAVSEPHRLERMLGRS